MMQVPVRLVLAMKPSVAPALLIAIASSTAVFTATPFLLPVIAEELAVSIGAASWISTAQLAGFVLASWLGGRFLRPVRRVFVTSALIGVASNLAAAVAPGLTLLAVTRLGSGVSLGLAAWFAWQAAFGDSTKTGDVAVVGPIVGTVSSPIVALLLGAIGLHWFFVVLAGVSALPLVAVRQVPVTLTLRPHRTRHAPTRAARAILVALTMITMGGSSVFIFAAAIGDDLAGLSTVTVSLLFSANALVGIPSARWPGRRGPAGIWFVMTGACAMLIASFDGQPIAFMIGMVAWGFVFWMGVPAVFALLAARSQFPEERAGDAQAVMALGRVFGPLIGGFLIAHGSATALGIVAAVIMTCASSLLLYVDRERFVFRRPFAAT